MSQLPPVETIQLATSHLQEPVVPAAQSWSVGKWLPHLGSNLAALAVIALPFGFVWLSQPHSPQLQGTQPTAVASYLNETVQATPLADAKAANPTPTTGTPLAINAPSTSPVPISLTASEQPGTYAYQLSLSQGFLTKAISYSQETSQTQDETDRQAILTYLQQALDAANQAIDLDSTQGLGFLARARVYKTASAVKPEFTKLAEQDLNIARALGVNGDWVNSSNPLQYLPTVVAAPEDAVANDLQTATATNAQSGRVTMPTGNRTLDVAFPELTPALALRVDVVDAQQNTSNAVFTVVSRREGQGFTIQSTVPVTADVELEWRAIMETTAQ